MASTQTGKPVPVAKWSELAGRVPAYALVGEADLAVVRYNDRVSVIYGRCLHWAALMSDGSVKGDDLICGLHGWDYRYDTGVSSHDNNEALHKFTVWVSEKTDQIFVDEAEIGAWAGEHPQPFHRDTYLGLYANPHGAVEEPYTSEIQVLARNGLQKVGHHGPDSAIGVPLNTLPRSESLQVLTGQLARVPLLDDAGVGTEVVTGPRAGRSRFASHSSSAR